MVKKSLVKSNSANTPGALILQWLSYAFWGWLAIALSFLVGVTATASVSGKTDSGDSVAYAAAASIILLVTAFVLDWFYMKKESVPKTGGAMIIMVVHAVIFGLFCAGWLIVYVFSLISIAINTGSNDTSTAISITAIIMAIVYLLLLLRTLDLKSKKLKKPAVIGVTVIALGALFLGFSGPIATTAATKNDRLVEQQLYVIGMAVDVYAIENDALPEDLRDIIHMTQSGSREAIEVIIDQGLVTYEPSKAAPTVSDEDVAQYAYTLCATYAHASGDAYDYWDGTRRSGEKDVSYYSLSRVSEHHPAGEECYELKTSGYASNY